jgi:hypothetical protein
MPTRSYKSRISKTCEDEFLASPLEPGREVDECKGCFEKRTADQNCRETPRTIAQQVEQARREKERLARQSTPGLYPPPTRHLPRLRQVALATRRRRVESPLSHERLPRDMSISQPVTDPAQRRTECLK